MNTWDFLPEFVAALRAQLESDEQRWGATWRHRDVGGQNERIFARLRDYYDQWRATGTPIPWLKVAGLALIAWVRETHPEVLEEELGQ